MRASLPLIAFAIWCTTISAAQQDSASGVNASPRDSTDILLLDHDFTSAGEFARVFLLEGQVAAPAAEGGSCSPD